MENVVQEHCYSVREIAEKLCVSVQTVTRIFEREPGVVIVKRDTPGKRAYRTLRIPARVLERVWRRMTR